MLNELWRRRAAWASSVALVLLGGAWVQAQDERKEAIRAIVRVAEGGELQEVKISNYWLGLECYAADETLRSHLDLAEGVGLAIEQVMADSPAAKAGFKKHDVLVKAGGKSLKNVADLMAAVEEAKENELAVEVFRGGKSTTIKVTPAERPKRDVLRVVPPNVNKEEILKLFERGKGDPREFNFRIVHPGMVLPGMMGGLPKDLSITVTKDGDSPAKITVKRGDKSWEATEGKLSELPDDIRPHVERMLGRGMMFQLPAVPGVPAVPSAPGARAGAAIQAEPGKRIEIRRFGSGAGGELKDISEQIEKLRKQLDELQQSLPKRDDAKPQSERPTEEMKPRERSVKIEA
jgi:hypothetical protein